MHLPVLILLVITHKSQTGGPMLVWWTRVRRFDKTILGIRGKPWSMRRAQVLSARTLVPLPARKCASHWYP